MLIVECTYGIEGRGFESHQPHQFSNRQGPFKKNLECRRQTANVVGHVTRTGTTMALRIVDDTVRCINVSKKNQSGCSSADRASVFGTECRGFKSLQPHHVSDRPRD